MKTQRYQLRISGMKEEEGQIRMATLRRIMDAIHATAESATRLLATGAGKGKGARPQWLDATIDFTITGLKPGSTVFDIEAPRLGETAYEQFSQEDLWNTRPSLDETALDLVAQSINEIQTDDPVGDYFDSAVLQAILKFGKAAGVRDVRYEMTPLGTAQGGFMLDKRNLRKPNRAIERHPGSKVFRREWNARRDKTRQRAVSPFGEQKVDTIRAGGCYVIERRSFATPMGQADHPRRNDAFQSQWRAAFDRGSPDQ